MLKKIPIPPSFSLVRKGKTLLLFRNDYKPALINMGLDEIDCYLGKVRGKSRTFDGRLPHPSISIDAQHAILRKYSHGGFLRFLTRDLYLFGSRSFQELALTQTVLSCGISTATPVAAIHRRVSPFFYRAYLITLEIPGAVDLSEWLQECGPYLQGRKVAEKRDIIRNAGLLVRKFHDAGFFHADLQLKNFLISQGRVFLIDFDRSFWKRDLSPEKRIRNLLRLNRSADKWQRIGLPITSADRWRFFSAYAGKNEEFRKALRRGLRFYGLMSFFHRLGWSFTGFRKSFSQRRNDSSN